MACYNLFICPLLTALRPVTTRSKVHSLLHHDLLQPVHKSTLYQSYDLLQLIHKSTPYCATTCYNTFISPLLIAPRPVHKSTLFQSYDLLQLIQKSTPDCATTCYNLFISPLITDLRPVKTCSSVHSALRPDTTCSWVNTIPALWHATFVHKSVRFWLVTACSWVHPHAFPINCYTVLMSSIYWMSMTW
jgi:hypothetical protein